MKLNINGELADDLLWILNSYEEYLEMQLEYGYPNQEKLSVINEVKESFEEE